MASESLKQVSRCIMLIKRPVLGTAERVCRKQLSYRRFYLQI